MASSIGEGRLVGRKYVVVSKPAEFQSWFDLARPGDECLYHFGHLGYDRVHIPLLEDVLKEVERAAERGLIHIVHYSQVIGSKRFFGYVAIKASKEHSDQWRISSRSIWQGKPEKDMGVAVEEAFEAAG